MGVLSSCCTTNISKYICLDTIVVKLVFKHLIVPECQSLTTVTKTVSAD
jgi:hypothetical protein